MFFRTKFGRGLRASLQNRTAADLIGINVNRTRMISVGIGVAVTACGGMVYGATVAFNPDSGYDLISRLLAIVILGGMGIDRRRDGLGGAAARARRRRRRRVVAGRGRSSSSSPRSCSSCRSGRPACSAPAPCARNERRGGGERRAGRGAGGAAPARPRSCSSRWRSRSSSRSPRTAARATMSIAVFAVMFMAAVSGWNIFSGYSGYLALGHAVFFGVGAYTIALTAQDWHVPAGWTIMWLLPLCGVVAGLAAIPIGLVALRTRRHTFVVVTIAVFFIFQTLATNLAFTGGTGGIQLPFVSWTSASTTSASTTSRS